MIFQSGTESLREQTPTFIFCVSLHNHPLVSCFILSSSFEAPQLPDDETKRTSSTQKTTRTVLVGLSSTKFTLLCPSVQGRINTVPIICKRQFKKGHQLWRGIHFSITSMTSDTMFGMVWLFKFIHTTVSYLNWIMYCSPIQHSQIIRKGF